MKNIFLLFLLFVSFESYSQEMVGHWETYDDNTQEKKAIIEIYKMNNLYFAKIVESFVSEKNAICETCKGSKKGQPINGLVIIENLKKDGEGFKDGTIMDPENGKTYKCFVELIDHQKLKVRGYLGLSIFGRTQYWIRKE